ncbi:MAG: universal stress protein [Ectothiorhodospiraceae bacterium]|nr:universal stress protein [Ectothiorhodospiraceae bacterium]MCH8503207.1 universal stress protein [Ectothiorhodospiraceae bacterium]
MPRCIVVPLDDSTRSLAALAPGSALAAQLGVPCHIVSVVSSEDDADTRKRTLNAELDRLGLEGTAVRVAVSDSPIAVLLQQADAEEDALLCMNTHARGPLRELLLGSVATEVIRKSHRPVILTGPRLSVHWTAPVRALLVCMDDSSEATTALKHAVTLARALEAELHLLRVLPISETGGAGTGSEGANWFTGSDWHTSTGNQEPPRTHEHQGSEWKQLKEHADRVRGETGLKIDWEVLESPYPAAAVADYADAITGSLIVTGTHDVSPLNRLALGSFALSVVRSAGCPVMVVSS